MDTLIQNIRLGARSLRRTAGFSAAAILTLALGIGLSTAVFTIAEALLLRPLPVRDQDRLVVLWGQKRDGSFDNHPVGLGDVREIARRTRALDRVAFFTYEGAVPVLVREAGRVSRFNVALVSGDFFEVLGSRPLLGRAFSAQDDLSGAAPVAVLSYGGWQRVFGGDPDVIGRGIRTHSDEVTYKVVGVMPQGLSHPTGVDFWLPARRAVPAKNHSMIAVHLVGRLASSASLTSAREEMTAYFRRAEAEWWQRDLSGVAQTLPRLLLGDTRSALVVFAVAAGLLLLIACINVANLLLVRGLARVREVAVRSALGAGRGRVIAQFLTETALLAIAGGVLGVVVAATAVQVFVAFAPAGLPRLDEIQLNGIALAAAAGITGIATLVFGLAPSVATSRTDAQEVLRSGARQSASKRSRLTAEALVVGQVALALVVLGAAGLVGRSLVKLEGLDLDFEPSRLLVAGLALRPDLYQSTTRQLAMLDELLPRLRATPGVRAATPTVAAPFSGSHGWDGRPAIEGQSPEQAADNPMLNMEVVAPDYFETLGVPVLRGRAFTEADREGAPLVVIISESAARHYWPRADPIGKRLLFGEKFERKLTVVGVVPDTRYRDLRTARPSIYFPLRQPFFPFVPLTLVVRTSGPPADLIPAIRRAVSETTPGADIVGAAPFETFLDRPLAQPRMNALLLAVFAAAAVMLAAVGLFGVMATTVRRRTRELGIRMALGATPAEVSGLVLRRGLLVTAIGTVAGLAGAVTVNRLLSALLYEVSPTDVLTLGGVALGIIGVAVLATALPARMGARIEPVAALRSE